MDILETLEPNVNVKTVIHLMSVSTFRLQLVWKPPNREVLSTTISSDDMDYDLSTNFCSSLIPGNPYFYLEKLARFELLGIPQIDYEPIQCNSNRQKLVPGIFEHKGNDVDTITGSHDFNCGDNLSTSPADEIGFCDIDLEPFPNSSQYGTTFGNQLNRVLKDKVSMPDIFSENEFLCCVKLGEISETASNCCSGHAIYVDSNDASKGMECRLPYGANLNVYFNRYVSSDGLLEDSVLREDEEPTGFKLADFDSRTGEIIPSEETDKILESLGEKYCTGDSNNNPRYNDSMDFQ